MKGIWGRVLKGIRWYFGVPAGPRQIRPMVVDGGYSTKSVNQNKVYFFSVMVEKFFWTKKDT